VQKFTGVQLRVSVCKILQRFSFDLKVRSKPDSLSMINGCLKARILLLFRNVIEMKKLSYVAQNKLIAA
jgi:hypothetical protein